MQAPAKYIKNEKVLIYYGDFADAVLLQICMAALDGITGNPIFNGINPSAADVLQTVNNYSKALAESATGDRRAIATKKAVKKEVQAKLRSWALFVNMIANGDDTVLANSNLPLVKKPEQKTVAAVTNIKIDQGINPGTLAIRYNKPKSTLAVMYSYTYDPITSNSNWKSKCTSLTKAVLENLEEGKRVWIQFTSVGSGGKEAVGEMVSQFVMPRSPHTI